MPIKHRLHALLYQTHSSHHGARIFQLGMGLLIVTNAVAVMLETVESLGQTYANVFDLIEWISILVFTVEYAIRIWVADLTPAFQRPISGRLRYAITPMAMIDLIAILPSLLFMTGLDLRILRILRLLRLLKLTRHSHALSNISIAIRSRADEIAISAIFMMMLMLISSSFIYYAEHDAQPDVYSSIPAAWWWSVSTLATIGYGDIYPITIPGKITAALTAIFGIGLFALPGGIIASALIETAKNHNKRCPHCGK